MNAKLPACDHDDCPWTVCKQQPIARARASDHETSHQAAQSVTGLRRKQENVLKTFRAGNMTLEELTEQYRHSWQHPDNLQSESGIRTRCAELVKLGLVEDSGERRKTRSGRNAIVWRVKA